MAISSAAPPPGSHLFSASFGGGPLPRKRRSRALAPIVLTGILLVGATVAAVQLSANIAFDDALAAFEESEQDARSEQKALEGAVAALDSSIAIATGVTASGGGALMDESSTSALLEATASARQSVADATATTAVALPVAADKPPWAWELFAAAAVLEHDDDTMTAHSSALRTASERADASDDALRAAGTAALQSAADAATGFEQVHVSARNLDIIALRTAASELSAAAAFDEPGAAAYSELEAAATAMLASEQIELSEKEGPLHDARVEVEAFARELAPGLLLDFDWAPYVNGYGDDDSMGGYATWWYGEPGYATIELTDSVAQLWPSERSRSLIAHEVGHAMSVKCQGMYDDSNQETIEAWATAWAISMGYTSEANGTSAYGAPPQELIDTAAGCR